MEDKRPELFNLSNQFIELYVRDIVTKNNEDMDELKERITDEQRENIKKSVMMLQNQVDEFVNKKKTRKKITENDVETEQSVSPLRAKLLGEGTMKRDAEGNEH